MTDNAAITALILRNLKGRSLSHQQTKDTMAAPIIPLYLEKTGS